MVRNDMIWNSGSEEAHIRLGPCLVKAMLLRAYGLSLTLRWPILLSALITIIALPPKKVG